MRQSLSLISTKQTPELHIAGSKRMKISTDDKRALTHDLDIPTFPFGCWPKAGGMIPGQESRC
eukprot:m.149831 g.149831  ORF g.149831 m.149831 type:complete len:63 (+) comp52785_c3_seq12:428-616(+)